MSRQLRPRPSPKVAAFLCLLIASFAVDCRAEPAQQERLRLGERIYREGVLPSGEPLKAIVQGDIPVDGTMFTCVSCHLRSGLGSTEGTVLTLPTNGGRLFRELRRGVEYDERRAERLPPWFDSGIARPAYTDQTLARALRFGVDPTGRLFSETMPRYVLGGDNLALLTEYLRGLCDEHSPGVSADTITIGTVVADDAPELERRAMVAALRAYVDSRNVQTRQPLKRAAVDLAETMDRSYRLLKLVVWELHGDRSGWEAQLQAHYRAQPVFALVGGISGGDWGPVHDFCERLRLPSVLPLAGLPVVSRDDWYTLYFSKGPHLEGEAAVRFLRRTAGAPAPPFVLVHRDLPAAQRLAAGAENAAVELGLAAPLRVALPTAGPPDAPFWRALGASHPGAAFLLWLEPADLAASGELAAAAGPAALFFFSGELLGFRPAHVPEALRARARLTWPRRLPGDGATSALVAANWARNRGLAEPAPGVYERVYFIGWLLTDALMMMRAEYYRDYLLDVLDMEPDQSYAIAPYPRLSFGPGQRYASKGCYVVGIGPGDSPAFTALSDWVVH